MNTRSCGRRLQEDPYTLMSKHLVGALAENMSLKGPVVDTVTLVEIGMQRAEMEVNADTEYGVFLSPVIIHRLSPAINSKPPTSFQQVFSPEYCAPSP